MKELITEEQADLIVLLLSLGVVLFSLAYGFHQNQKVKKERRKFLWAYTGLCALVGPVIWAFWQAYNSIENYYGLDSLKALKINFCIAVGIGAAFFALFSLVPRWIGPQARPASQGQASRRRK